MALILFETVTQFARLLMSKFLRIWSIISFGKSSNCKGTEVWKFAILNLFSHSVWCLASSRLSTNLDSWIFGVLRPWLLIVKYLYVRTQKWISEEFRFLTSWFDWRKINSCFYFRSVSASAFYQTEKSGQALALIIFSIRLASVRMITWHNFVAVIS